MKIEFDSVEDLTANLVKKGQSEEDAEKIAKSMFDEQSEEEEDEENAEPSELEKSVSENTTFLKKILEKLGLSKSSDDEEEEEEEDEEELGKSIFDNIDVDANGTFDAGSGIVALDKSLQESNSQFAEFQKSYAESLIALSDNDKAFAKSISAVIDGLKSIEEGMMVTDGVNTVPIGKALEGFAKQTVGKIILQSSDSPGGDEDDKGTEEGDTKMSFGELQKSLDAGVEAGTITQNEATRAESAFRSKEQKILDEVLEKIKPKSE